jgi:hypothetical protein
MTGNELNGAYKGHASLLNGIRIRAGLTAPKQKPFISLELNHSKYVF